ncbi:MAG: TIGR00730 family Rossman fold protein [Bacteriovoracaceae bacterium]|nr:TIGR00730 family Rossman fold protein [Bacteriovoracaceae bacterium]
MKKLCIFCGSSTNVAQNHLDLGKEVGHLLAEKNIGLVYGAGSTGVMGSLADSVLEKGGKVWGVIPDFMIPWEVCHQNLTDLKITKTMHERKQIMYDYSDGFVALPGGLGTMEELCEILTWRQIGTHEKHVWILNPNGFYDGLMDHFKKLHHERFVSDEHLELIQERNDMNEIVSEFLNGEII